MEAIIRFVKNSGWVELFALLLFFFNSFLLPEGLTFTLLLTPVCLYFVYRQKRLITLGFLMLPLMFYAVIHLINGVVLSYYFISTTMIICVIIFVIAARGFILDNIERWDRIFRMIVVVNFILALVSLPLLFIPLLKPLVWYIISISHNIQPIPRLKLFTSEASHYSFMLTPLVIYFYTRLLFLKTENIWWVLLITIPLLLSFSMGVIGFIFISGLVVILLNANRIFTRKRLIALAGITALVLLTFYLAYHFFPTNPLYMRLSNIASGRDTSTNGRTFEAFILADKILELKSYWFGVGWGQLKVLGRDIIVDYYKYVNIPKAVRIPNASAETMTYLGYTGLGLRLFLEVFLFFKTNVFNNPFRLWLFIFLFLFQFTGSYVTNTFEYIAWLFVFLPLFPDLDTIKPLTGKT